MIPVHGNWEDNLGISFELKIAFVLLKLTKKAKKDHEKTTGVEQ